jgi:hypothetical protein
MRDDRTPNKNYPLPHEDNYLEDDVGRLREALNGVDESIKALETNAEDAAGDLIQSLGDIRDELSDLDSFYDYTTNHDSTPFRFRFFGGFLPSPR